MPTQQTVTYTLYTFAELDDDAKEKAREWYRQGALDYAWYDCIFDDAKTIGGLMGVAITDIHFSGFSSQGDGASFTGTYEYRKGSVAAVKEHAPDAEGLHSIAQALQDAQRKCFYDVDAHITCCGVYSHSGTMSCHVRRYDRSTDMASGVEDDITDNLRGFADWIYCSLEAEHDWLLADEQVDESITANEYTFDETGNRLDV